MQMIAGLAQSLTLFRLMTILYANILNCNILVILAARSY